MKPLQRPCETLGLDRKPLGERPQVALTVESNSLALCALMRRDHLTRLEGGIARLQLRRAGRRGVDAALRAIVRKDHASVSELAAAAYQPRPRP